ncbi:MAG: signal peptidase I [Tepidiformaceae bacterium]
MKKRYEMAVLAAAIGTGLALGRRFRRFEIAGSSMLPTLEPNDWVFVDEYAYRTRLPRRGEIVVARDPRKPARQLVKRVVAIDLHGAVQIEGDNRAESTDSRAFGPIATEGLVGRVRWRYWPLRRVGAVR